MSSSLLGCKNSTTSSAYSEMRCRLPCLRRGCSKPRSCACNTRELRTSITRIKSIGDKGSPCLRPLLWWMISPGSPLTRTLVEEENNSLEMILHHKGPKPSWLKISNRKGHETESKALPISNFRRIQDTFLHIDGLGSLLHHDKVIVYTSTLHKGTLVYRNQFRELWCKSIGQDLSDNSCKTMY